MTLSLEQKREILDQIDSENVSDYPALIEFVRPIFNDEIFRGITHRAKQDNPDSSKWLEEISAAAGLPRLATLKNQDEFWFELALYIDEIRDKDRKKGTLNVDTSRIPDSLDIFNELISNPLTSSSILETYVGLAWVSDLPEKTWDPDYKGIEYYEAISIHPNLNDWARREIFDSLLNPEEPFVLIDLLRNPNISKMASMELLNDLWGFFDSHEEGEKVLKFVSDVVRGSEFEQKVKGFFVESLNEYFEESKISNPGKHV